FSTDGLPLAPQYLDFILAGCQYAMPQLRLYPLKIDKEELSKLNVPTLLMIGEQEVIYHADKAMEYAKASVPHIQCVLVRQANHTLTIEYADLINTTSLEFFRSFA